MDYRTYSRADDINNDGRLDVVVMQQDLNRNNADQLVWFDIGDFKASVNMTSQVVDGGANPGWDAFSWKANVPASTLLSVSVRAGNDANNLGVFSLLPDVGADVSTVVDSNARYFQYKLEMSSSDVNQSPVLTEIGFNLSTDAPHQQQQTRPRLLMRARAIHTFPNRRQHWMPVYPMILMEVLLPINGSRLVARA